MNVLSFDIEDWYNCDFSINKKNWDDYEVRIYENTEKILCELEQRNIKATFFCLGWIAKHHPNVIRMIHSNGHHVGCHTYKHDLLYTMSKDEFYFDTLRTKNLLEDLIGASVDSFRAPGFSIDKNNIWVFDVLTELGILFDASIFPAPHDYGGFKHIEVNAPAIVIANNGMEIKEFPMSVSNFLCRKTGFSGGGYFRLFPYEYIRAESIKVEYLMTYFHPRDFDPGQPILKDLSLSRRFKSYTGLKSSFDKFKKYIDDFQFVSLIEADKCVNWKDVKRFKLSEI